MAEFPANSGKDWPNEEDPARVFPPTSISLYQRIVSGAAELSEEALGEFFELYWYPMYALMRSRGESHEDAADLVQGFVTDQLLQRDQVRNWNPQEGRLRTFLKVALDRYRVSAYRKATALKRGGSQIRISMDFAWAEGFYAGSLLDRNSPDRLYDRAWADSTMERALAWVSEDYARRGRMEEFQLLSQHLSARTGEEAAIGYREIAERLGTTANNVKQKMSGYRQRLRNALIAATAQTVESEQVADEVNYLFQVLLGAP